jgi:hypothetical protein
MSENLREILEYLDKKGISYTLETNPSKEKIEYLKNRRDEKRAKIDLLRKSQEKNS